MPAPLGIVASAGKQLAYGLTAGATTSTISTPDTAGLSITGDFDFRALVACPDWTPGAAVTLGSKFGATGNQRSWFFGLNAAGGFTGQVSSDGSATSTVNSLSGDGTGSTVVTGITDTARRWVGMSFDADNGASKRAIAFWIYNGLVPPDDITTWTQIGVTQTIATAAGIFDSTAPFKLGALDSGGASGAATARYFAAQLRDGINGTKVLDWDLTRDGRSSTTSVASTGQTMTFNGSFTYGWENVA